MRPLIVGWVLLMAAMAALFASFCFLRVIEGINEQFTIGLILPVSGVLLTAYACSRARRSPHVMRDQSSSFEPSTPFSVQPSFAEEWLSGGMKTSMWIMVLYVLPLSTVLSSTTSRTANSFALAVAGTLTIVWVCVPVLKGLRDNASVAVVRAVTRHRRRRWRQHRLRFRISKAPHLGRAVLFS